MQFKKAFLSLCVISVCSLVISAVTYWNKTWERMIDDILRVKMTITPENNEILDFWADPPMHSTFDIYLWNVTNPHSVLNNGSKPIMQEIGPIRYRNVVSRTNVNFTTDQSVIYRNSLAFILDGNSPVSENTTIVTLNVPYVIIMKQLDVLPKFVRGLIVSLMKGNKYDVFMKKQAKEIIWGYDDPILQKLHSLVPSLCPKPGFGWFMDMNNSLSFDFDVETGVTGMKNWTYIKSWKGMKKLDIWDSAPANSILGTDGFAVPPNIKKYEDLNVFFDATCRSFKLKFIESANSRTWIYKSDPNTWKSVYDIPENRGYCVDGRCSKHGIINMEKCTEVVQGVSAPIFASQPHFLAGDSSLISDFEGVLPNEAAHEFYFMEVDPLTGFMPDVKRRMQLNVGFERKVLNKKLKVTEDDDQIIFPTVWFEQSVKPKKFFEKQMITSRILIIFTLNLSTTLFILSVIGLLFSVPLMTKNSSERVTPDDNHDYQPVSDNSSLAEN